MHELAVGADLSDLIARIVVVDPAGQVVSRADTPPGARPDPKAIREALKRAVAKVKGGVAAVGVALPSAFDELPTDVSRAIRDAASRDTEIVPISAGNAAAIAEHWIGAARGAQQVVQFSIAEHVHAGILIDGKAWRGANGFASSVSWMAMNPVEREDYRRLGGLEAEIASAGIVRRFVWRIKSGDESAIADAVKGDFSRISAADIFTGSRSGDGVSISVVRDTAKYVGMAMANLVTLFDPEIVVLGGVIAHSGDVMLDAIRTECARRLHPQQSDRVRIVLSTLGHDAVAIGAARAAARVRSSA
jgi:glucokinase